MQMTLTLSIEMDNAGFDDDPGQEAGRILHEAAARIINEDLKESRGFCLHDINGNKCGELNIKS